MSTFFLHFDAKIENNFLQSTLGKNIFWLFVFCEVIFSGLFAQPEAKKFLLESLERRDSKG
jgi:hypothetical protein